MILVSSSIKKSGFNAQTAVLDSDYFDFVRNGTNYKVSFADVKSSIGITVDLASVGSPLGNPVMYKETSTSYKFRSIESGSGVIAQISPQNGIEVGLNLTQDVTGSPIFDDVGATKPTVASLVEGQGISITKTNDAITIQNTVDPATGLSNRVVVTQSSDLAGTLDSTKEYFIDGVIDMTGVEVEVPVGGLNITGYDFNISKLICADNSYTMFKSGAALSGDLLMRDVAIEVTGTGSQVYNLTDVDSTHAVELARVNFNGCSSLGALTNYRQGLESGNGRFGGMPELTLAGAWAGGYLIETTIVRGLTDGSYTLFKAGAGFSMTSRFRCVINVDLPASASLTDFVTGNFVNPSSLQFRNCFITRNGVFNSSDTNLTPNVSSSDLASEWLSNDGLNNTFVGGELMITSEVTTTISTAGVFVDLDGTWTTADLQHFDEPANGQLRHLGDSPRDYSVTGELVLDSTSNDEIDLKVVVYRAATTTFEDQKTIRRVINNLQGGRDVAYFGLKNNITLANNDYVKLQVANVNATNDITAELDSFFDVEKR